MEYYYSAINNEKAHDLRNTLPVSYANVGILFLNVGLYDKAVEYLRIGLKNIDYVDKDYFRFNEKKLRILSDIMTAATHVENINIEEIEKTYDRMVRFNKEGVASNTLYQYYLGLMSYFFWKKDYIRAKKEYINAKEITQNTGLGKLVVLYSFIEECDRHNLDLEFFEEDLLEVKDIHMDINTTDEPVVYNNLRKYYISKGDDTMVQKLEMEYRAFLEESLRMSKEKQADSIQIIENAFKYKEESYIKEDNKEFRLVAEEAIRNKDELQKSYNLMRMTHEIGLKLASYTELNEVVSLIYKNIRQNIPADAFMFLAAEPENNQLRSLLSYNMGVKSPEFTIGLDREDSALVRCYLNDKIISTDDDNYTPLFGYPDNDVHYEDEEKMKSALFIPLSTGDMVIGAYSVQSKYEKAYSPDTLLFLKELRPYLVIALNNAIHSQKLQNEIRKNKETQAKLKEANDMLSRIAGLDALTQISNRREFAEKFHELRKEASKLAKTVSVFMFDIDDFKKYNDTYGHFAGDEALKAVAEAINRNIIERGGIAARFGGEEFIGACTGLTPEENFELGNKIRQEVYDLGIEHKESAQGILSISAGIAIAGPFYVITKSEIMGLADEMLYEAKKTGKNKVVIKTL